MSTHRSTSSSHGSVLPDENTFDFRSNGLRLELAPFGLENLNDYELGGHHPVHIGDLLGDNGRYRIIHKLGNGGFANIWLARDTEAQNVTRYVALKILIAESSTMDCPELLTNRLKTLLSAQQHVGDGMDCICLPLEQFEIHGPNGDHLCSTYPVLGPSLAIGLSRASDDPAHILRSICLATVKAIGFLHSHGICHGDITTSNILLRISGLSGLTEDEVLQILGEPIRNPVLRVSGEVHGEPTVPKYLVYPVNWRAVDAQYTSEQSCLIDFGEAFESLQPPDDLGTPGPYRSPELILEKAAGTGSDLWALGCTLFEIRTGRKLFDVFDDDDDSYLDAMVQILGEMPEPWWSTKWEGRKKMYKDEMDDQGRAVAITEYLGNADGFKEAIGVTRIVHPSVAEGARSLQDKLAPGLWYLSSERGHPDRHWDISEREKEVFAELLGRLLEYDPMDRIGAKAAIDHEWFKL